MKFTLTKNLYTKKGKKMVWLEAGEYPVIRFVDGNRVLLDVSTPNSAPKRLLAVVNRNNGLINDSASKAA